MKRKIIASMMLIILLFTNYVFAANGTAKKLNTVAKIIDEDIVIDRKFSAVTYLTAQEYSNKDYSSILNIEQSNEPTYFSESKKFYIKELDDGNDENSYVNRYAAIKMKKTDTKDDIKLANNNYITFNYKDAIISGNNKYDTKIIINGLTVNNIEEDYEILFQVGRYRKSNKEPLQFYPGVGCTETSGSVGINISEYFEKNDQKAKVSGIYKISDLDQKQGVTINRVIKDIEGYTQEVADYDGTGEKNFQYKYKNSDILNNIYMNEAENGTATDKIEYIDYGEEKDEKELNIYCSVAENLRTDISDLYFTFENIEAIEKSFQFNKISAFSTYGFTDIRNYYSVTTNVINGKITTSKQDLLKGDNFTVKYVPTDETYYLKRITINGNDTILKDNIKTSYTFSNIKENNQIEVEYAKKLTVEFDSKGGTAVTTQLVIPGEKAMNPAEPTKEGYTFKGWYTDENYTTVYDFNNPVNENKILYAKWEKNDVYHNIKYVIIGTPDDNNANNPDKYKEGDTTAITISSPTKEGYTFSGWYENQELSGNKVATLNVSNKTEDITLYGKWTKNEPKNVEYKINHYLEDANGTVKKENKKYKLNNTETKQAKVGSTVTENAQTFEGYEAEQNTLNSIVRDDENLVLNFYYNKKQYNITFDSKGGTKVEDQTKLYGEKVTKPSDPTKEGYRFLYWYEEKDGKKVIYDFDKLVNSDKKLIAEWEEIKIIPDDSDQKTEKQIPAEKEDKTISNKILPNTGIMGTMIGFSLLMILGLFFGIRYIKLKKYIK